MKIVVVDDEKLIVDNVVKQIKALNVAEEVKGFQFAEEALKYLEENPADIVVLDIEMPEISGLETAFYIRKQHPETSVIFLTAYSQYAINAFDLHVDGYLLKPVDSRRLLLELQHCKSKKMGGGKGLIRVQTFGNFEVFVDNNPVKFSRHKSKELLAYLIDRRGAGVTISSIIACLLEDRSNDVKSQALVRQYILDLTSSLKTVNAEAVLNKSKNNISVNVDLIDCDYYEFIKGNAIAVNSFYGEYMNQYSWAEFTAAGLQRK